MLERVLYVDEINTGSLFYIVTHRGGWTKLRHFEQCSSVMRRTVWALSALRLLRLEPELFPYRVKDKEYVDSHSDALDISQEIERREVSNNRLVRFAASRWEANKLLLYFRKLIEIDVQPRCLQIVLAKGMASSEDGADSCSLLVSRVRWFAAVREYGLSKGVQVIGYRRWIDPRQTSRSAVRPFWHTCKSVLSLASTWFSAVTGKTIDAGKGRSRTGDGPTLALQYYHRKLSFDPVDRSEFFWLDAAAVSGQDILLYGYRDSRGLDSETVERLAARGIRLMGRGKGIRPWIPTWRVAMTALGLLAWLSGVTVSGLFRGRLPAYFYFSGLVRLSLEYAYWLDFYRRNRVAVNITAVNTQVGQILALDSLNGLSIGFQISTSLFVRTTKVTAGENIQFVFSPLFENIKRAVDPPADCYVHTGYIYDGAMEAVQKSERAAVWRRGLESNGAEFVVCYFDEGPVNSWYSRYRDVDVVSEYRFFLEWLLEDSALGIVFKPKRSIGIFERLAPIASLVDEALATGRCKFLTDEALVGSIFPAEAATISDVCVSHLWGATTTLESYLAGTRCLVVDLEGLEDRPIYPWGADGVIHRSWQDLRDAVDRYRLEPGRYPEFGDWSPGVHLFDQFRDGNASVRMGQFIGRAFTALKEGSTREEAVAMAKREYERDWSIVVETGPRPEQVPITQGS